MFRPETRWKTVNGSQGSQVGRSEVKDAPWRSCDRAVCRSARPLQGFNRRHSANGFSQVSHSFRAVQVKSARCMYVNLIPPSRHRPRHRANKTKLTFRRLATFTSSSSPRPLFSRHLPCHSFEPPSLPAHDMHLWQQFSCQHSQGREELPSFITEGAIVAPAPT